MPADHPNKEKQIQRVTVSQTIEQYDTTIIRVRGADDGTTIKLQMAGPDVNATVTTTEELTPNCTAEELRAAIVGFYNDYFGVSPVVYKAFEDLAGAAVLAEDFDGAQHVIVFTIQVHTAISTCTQFNMNAIGWSRAEFEFTYPCDDPLLQSDPPLSGEMYLTCYSTDGNVYATSSMGVCASAGTVQWHLENDCSFLKKKISVS